MEHQWILEQLKSVPSPAPTHSHLRVKILPTFLYLCELRLGKYSFKKV